MRKLACSLLLLLFVFSTSLAAESNTPITIKASWIPVYESAEVICYADKDTIHYDVQTQTATVALVLLNKGKNAINTANLKIDYAHNTVLVLNEEIYKEYGKKPEKINGKTQPTPIYPDTPTSEITNGIKALIH